MMTNKKLITFIAGLLIAISAMADTSVNICVPLFGIPEARIATTTEYEIYGPPIPIYRYPPPPPYPVRYYRPMPPPPPPRPMHRHFDGHHRPPPPPRPGHHFR